MQIAFTTLCLTLALASFSYNAHAQWIQTNGPYAGSITTLASNGNDLLAGKGGAINGTTIYRSTNGGINWMETTIDSPYTAVPNVTELAAHGDVFLAGSNGYGIFRSVDRGMTWSASSLSGGGTSFYGFLDFAGYVFAAGGPYSSNSDSLYRSSDNGARWSAIKGHPSKALARVGNTLVET